MAFHNRPRFPPHNFNNNAFNKNDFHPNQMRNGPHMMRNYNDTSHMQVPRFPGVEAMSGSFAGRPPYQGPNESMQCPPPPPAFRGRPMQGPMVNNHGPMVNNHGPMVNNRMPPPGMGGYHHQPFQEHNFFRPSGPPPTHRMRYPPPPPQRHPMHSERFFVPWNQRPKSFFAANRMPSVRNGPRQPLYNQKKAEQKPVDDKPNKKKKNKKRKYAARPRDDSKKLKPWMTDEIYEEVRKKNEMYVKCKNEDNPELWQEFRLLRNRVSSLVKDAKLKGGFITKKQKEDDNVERNFSCDTCDRAFAEESELQAHFKDHAKCDCGGCSFEAHPKVVELHKKMQHETGYADAIRKLSNPEEIENWRKERRSHYPTAENIKKRQAEMKEKRARGEVVVTKEFGKFRQQGYSIRASRFHRQRFRGRNFSRGRARINYRHSQAFMPNVREHKLDTESDSDDDTHIKLPAFRGMSCENHSYLNDTESETILNHCETTEQIPLEISTFNVSLSYVDSSSITAPSFSESNNSRKEPQFCDDEQIEMDVCTEINEMSVEDSQEAAEQSLSRASYHESMNSFDDDNDVDDCPEVMPIERTPVNEYKEHVDTQASCKPKRNYQDSEKDNASVKPFDSSGTYNRSDRKSWSHHGNSEQNIRPPPAFVKHNLLEKLLAKDIRHERNVILQCVRYIVKNDFFQK